MRRTAYALGAVVFGLVGACEDTTDDPHPELVQDAGAKGNAEKSDNTKKTDAAASGGTTKIDRSALKDVGTDKPLDYSDPRMWLCRPGNDPDECDIDQDATELDADGSRKIIKHQKAEDPKFDCFYVYPTVKLTSGGPMTDFSDISITLDPLLNQAARFNRICRVYAPLYRQNGVVPGAGGAPTMGGSFDLGLQDVRDALKYYFEHLSQGRKVVLMGHSQGTGMLTSAIAMDVDPNPALRAQMLSTLLLGGGVTVPTGKVVGGSFQNIPLCEKAGQTGCAIAYNSYSAEVPPTAMSTFGHATQEGQAVACTEPAALAGRPGEKYRGSYAARTHVNAGLAPDGIDMLPSDITTPYVVFRDVLRGQCQDKNGAQYLEITLDRPADDKRPLPPYRKPAIEAALGLHLVDYTVELDDLIDAVEMQGKTIN